MNMLIVLTSHDQLGNTGKKTGFYLSELTHALEMFEKAGMNVTFASPKGGKAPVDGLDRNDRANTRYLDDPKWMQRIENTVRLADVDPSTFDAVYVPGGHGTVFDLPNNADVQRVIAGIYDRGGVVGAVCHGPAALVNVKLKNGGYLVSGQDVSSFTDEEEEAVSLTKVVPFLLESTMRERGARFSKAPKFEAHVAVSDRLVTGQNPASARRVGEELVRVLNRTQV